MSIAVQTDLLDEEEQAAKKKREMAAKSQAHLKVNHQLADFTILGRKKASYDAEPRLAYNATYDLLNDPRCLVPWSEEYSVGIPLIDGHHKILVRLINDLHEALKQGYRFEVGSVIDNLVEYTEFHFGMEELQMEKYRYKPMKITKHKETHRNFVKKIFDVREDFRTMKTENIGEETLDFLRDWLLTHILYSDKKMCQFFLEQIKREEQGLPMLGEPVTGKEKASDDEGSEYLESSISHD